MFVDTALREDAQRRIREIGQADIVVGIPTFKNARTIGNVMQTLAEGLLHYFPDHAAVIVVADGMSTDDTVQVAQNVAIPSPIEKVVTMYQGLAGKGSAVRAILEIAVGLGAQAVAVVDGDLRSITPAWVEKLVGPPMSGQYDFVTPYYTRHANEVAINDLLAYPLTRTLYGPDIRHPLGGEVGLSGELAHFLASKDVWETDVARFGIHIWMTTLAITEGWRLVQAPLGTKTHDFKDPTVGFEPKFLQVVGTMFRMMTIYRRVWPKVNRIRAVPLWGEAKMIEPEPIPASLDAIWEAFNKGVSRFWDFWPTILTPENWDAVRDGMELVNNQLYHLVIPPELWARVVYDFAVVYNKGEGDPDKVATALLPLYYARKANLIEAAAEWDYATLEQHVAEQARIFFELKPYLLERWETYVPWGELEF